MNMKRLNNKWDLGKVNWQPSGLPSYLDEFSGVLPVQVTLDSAIGPETIVCVIDRTSFAREIADLKPFRLNLDSGLVPFQTGPVLYMLFWLPRPNNDGVLAAFDNTLNPHDQGHLQPYWDLARQSHWHVFVLGESNEELNWFEFENSFGVSDTLEQVSRVIPSHPCTDFDKSKADFEARFSIEDLLNIGR